MIPTFDEYFRALWGYPPFSWQGRLAALAIEDRWPGALDLPTSSGKTAALDIAVYALAARAAAGLPPGPRRIWNVVNRRVIVDAAYDRARHLSAALEEPSDPVLRDVADVLRRVAGTEGRPVDAFQLRGGTFLDESWMRAPERVALISATPDQFGSRLLFRGYGVAERSLSVAAGLAGRDSLVLLDEVQTAPAFLATLAAVQRLQGDDPRALRVVPLSATLPAGFDPSNLLSLDEADHAEDQLGPRLRANKQTRLLQIDADGGPAGHERAARALAEAAEAMARDGVESVAVLTNSVACARLVHDRLHSRLRGTAELLMLTGRMRPIDRDDWLGRHFERLRAGRDVSRPIQPVVLVATQCLEAGADLDFGAMLTEAAPLDSLLQRFGRLDRLGRRGRSRGLVVMRSGWESEGDWLYGPPLAATWRLLQSLSDPDGMLDFGIDSLGARLPQDRHEYLTAPAEAAVLDEAVLRRLAATSPAPRVDLQPYLHGLSRPAAEVSVCFRDDLALLPQAIWPRLVEALPPTPPECLAVPLHAARAYLRGEEERDDAGDLTEDPTGEARPRRSGEPLAAMRWTGYDGERSGVVTDPDTLRPGDVLVLPSDERAAATLGTISSGSPLDLAERAVLQQYRRPICRLGLLADPIGIDPDDPDLESARESLQRLGRDTGLPDWRRRQLTALGDDPAPELLWVESGWAILVGSRRLDRDRGKRRRAEQPVTLEAHSTGVAGWAVRIARHLGEDELVARTLERAGLHHDRGKSDSRFQALLCGGVPFREPLAKSLGMTSRERREAAAQSAGWPVGLRHELISLVSVLRDAAHNPESDRDVFLHLIASHHGRTRPLISVVDDEAISGLSGTELADRYWRLCERLGPWRLAHLEAILRCADWAQSEQDGT